MTTVAELSRMLNEIDDREIQSRCLRSAPSHWMTGPRTPLHFDLEHYEYRLKPEPKITYYRVYKDDGGEFIVAESNKVFMVWSSGGIYKHIHDFQIEED